MSDIHMHVQGCRDDAVLYMHAYVSRMLVALERECTCVYKFLYHICYCMGCVHSTLQDSAVTYVYSYALVQIPTMPLW